MFRRGHQFGSPLEYLLNNMANGEISRHFAKDQELYEAQSLACHPSNFERDADKLRGDVSKLIRSLSGFEDRWKIRMDFTI